MDLGLNGKVAIVAAASQGIGRATALGLSREGARVVICARDEARLAAARDAIQSETGGEILAIAADVTQTSAVDGLVETATKTWGTVHVLVNNAGGPPPGTFDDVDDGDWQQAFELTLMSAVRMTRAVLPYMRKQRWGRIINISSYTIKQPIETLLLSNSLRLSVTGWAKSLAGEVAGDGILVNTVCPGWTYTDRVAQIFAARSEREGRDASEIETEITRTIPIGRLGRPDEIADVIAFLASERAGYISGTAVLVDGGIVQSPL